MTTSCGFAPTLTVPVTVLVFEVDDREDAVGVVRAVARQEDVGGVGAGIDGQAPCVVGKIHDRLCRTLADDLQ